MTSPGDVGEAAASEHVEPVELPELDAAISSVAAVSSEAPPVPTESVGSAAEEAAPGRLGRIRRIAGRLPHPSLRTKGGLVFAFLLVAGLGAVVAAGGVVAVNWTETADFCGRCHTMGPELKAYQMSPHRELTCAECHVEPGLGGWIKAKLKGTKQLFEVVTGQFPKPIPPPDHADLPSTTETCLRCHDLAPLVAKGGPVKLILNARYQKDERNTRDQVALVVRPTGFGGETGTRGVHWHVASDVEYVRADERAQKIDLVTVTNADGTKEQFIASSEISSSTDVQPDIDRLVQDQTTRQMDCIDCHNRVGHGVQSPDQAIDDSLEAGRIDSSLPFIKLEASNVLSAEYASVEDADQAIEGLRDAYAQRYPLVAQEKSGQIDAAIADLKVIYRLVATPEMRVSGLTYPSNLGHQTSPGCFRCHDGAHYKVVDGAATNETIPSACATCHTFPQIGAIESGVLIGQRPASHDDRLWVFDHKAVVSTVDPGSTACGACHTRTYCENCHNTPTVKVPHEGMVYNHAELVRNLGTEACATCHQPSYCAQCHADQVLPNPYPGLSPSPSPSP
jgi:nitrate/TMAO reductase-like tetraheme cytochrome c subunit